MPGGKQFGSIFTNGITANETDYIIAHELDHGRWRLQHTFDKTYGEKMAKYTTDNLMDYANPSKGNDYKNKIHLAKWQWEQLNDPAWFTNPLDGDQKGMINIDNIKEKIKKRLKEEAKEIIKDAAQKVAEEGGDKLLYVIINGIYYYYNIDFNNLSYADWVELAYLYAKQSNSPLLIITGTNENIIKMREILNKSVVNKDIQKLMKLSNDAYDRDLNIRNITEVEQLSQKVIAANSHEYEIIMGLLFEFKYGVGLTTREFDQNSILTKSLKNFELVEDGRKHFYSSRTKDNLTPILKDSKE